MFAYRSLKQTSKRTFTVQHKMLRVSTPFHPKSQILIPHCPNVFPDDVYRSIWLKRLTKTQSTWKQLTLGPIHQFSPKHQQHLISQHKSWIMQTQAMNYHQQHDISTTTSIDHETYHNSTTTKHNSPIEHIFNTYPFHTLWTCNSTNSNSIIHNFIHPNMSS